jgi:hypothetical protein
VQHIQPHALADFGRLPLLVRWWVQALKFWNHMAHLPESRLLQHVFTADVELVATKKKCW